MRNHHDMIKDQIDQPACVLKEMLGMMSPQNPAAGYHQVITKVDETMKEKSGKIEWFFVPNPG